MSPLSARLPSLSAKEALVLDLLGRSSKMYGLELVAASEGALKRGTVYVTLGRMEQKGFISSRLEDGPPPSAGLPRRLYTATPFGREVHAAAVCLLVAPARCGCALDGAARCESVKGRSIGHKTRKGRSTLPCSCAASSPSVSRADASATGTTQHRNHFIGAEPCASGEARCGVEVREYS